MTIDVLHTFQEDVIYISPAEVVASSGMYRLLGRIAPVPPAPANYGPYRKQGYVDLLYGGQYDGDGFGNIQQKSWYGPAIAFNEVLYMDALKAISYRVWPGKSLDGVTSVVYISLAPI